jgi:magnesium chelatase family protein
MNPCPCGYYGDPVRECTCSSSTITRYKKRISGPLIDRIDIHVEVPRVDYDKLQSDRLGEPSRKVQARVEDARDRQRERFQDADLQANAGMHPAQIRKFCTLEPEGRALLGSAMRQLHLSARSYHRVLKLSRTIADLDNQDRILSPHLAEALQYQPRGRRW